MLLSPVSPVQFGHPCLCKGWTAWQRTKLCGVCQCVDQGNKASIDERRWKFRGDPIAAEDFDGVDVGPKNALADIPHSAAVFCTGISLVGFPVGAECAQQRPFAVIWSACGAFIGPEDDKEAFPTCFLFVFPFVFPFPSGRTIRQDDMSMGMVQRVCAEWCHLWFSKTRVKEGILFER